MVTSKIRKTRKVGKTGKVGRNLFLVLLISLAVCFLFFNAIAEQEEDFEAGWFEDCPDGWTYIGVSDDGDVGHATNEGIPGDNRDYYGFEGELKLCAKSPLDLEYVWATSNPGGYVNTKLKSKFNTCNLNDDYDGYPKDWEYSLYLKGENLSVGWALSSCPDGWISVIRDCDYADGYGCGEGSCISGGGAAYLCLKQDLKLEEPECVEDLDCGEISYGENYCSGEDVYRAVFAPVCDSGFCGEDVYSELLEECAYGCLDGVCLEEPECECDEDCAEDSCDDWTGFCFGDNAYEERTCNDFSCLEEECVQDIFDETRFVEECAYGCLLGTCLPKPPECVEDSECGDDSCEGLEDFYCVGNDIYETLECYDFYCSDNECGEDISSSEVYVNSCVYGCDDGTCLNEPNQTLPFVEFVMPESKTYDSKELVVAINFTDADSVWWFNGSDNLTYIAPLVYEFGEGHHVIYAYAENENGVVSDVVGFDIELEEEEDDSGNGGDPDDDTIHDEEDETNDDSDNRKKELKQLGDFTYFEISSGNTILLGGNLSDDDVLLNSSGNEDEGAFSNIFIGVLVFFILIALIAIVIVWLLRG